MSKNGAPCHRRRPSVEAEFCTTMHKTFRFKERLTMDFHLDAYNALHDMKFSNPNTAFGSATT